jgi:F-type H+-transporting ATPase subunit delta
MNDGASSGKVAAGHVDPAAGLIAATYSSAYLDAAGPDAAAAVEELQSLVTDVLDPQQDFELLLCSAATSTDTKLQLVERVFANRCSPLLTNTLRVLGQHDRLELLREVAASAAAEWDRRQGRLLVTVTTAHPLTAGLESELRDRLTQQLGASVSLDQVVDPEVLGGLIIRIGDTVFDGSVRSRLKQLRAELREGYLHEVQRGRDRFSHPSGN